MARVIRGLARRDPLDVLAALEAERARALEELRESLVGLATAIARRAVLDALTIEPDKVRALADQALERVSRDTRITLRIHPGDAPHLEDLDVALEEDASLSPGDCVVECGLGEVDGRLEARLERLAEALRGET